MHPFTQPAKQHPVRLHFYTSIHLPIHPSTQLARQSVKCVDNPSRQTAICISVSLYCQPVRQPGSHLSQDHPSSKASIHPSVQPAGKPRETNGQPPRPATSVACTSALYLFEATLWGCIRLLTIPACPPALNCNLITQLNQPRRSRPHHHVVLLPTL